MTATRADYLTAFVERIKAQPPTVGFDANGTDEGPSEPSWLAGQQRSLTVIDRPPPSAARETVSIEEARTIIWENMVAYSKIVNPDHMLLVKAVPGVGKTHAALRFAETLAAQGRRVLYAAPRHDFIDDLRRIAVNPANLYEWQPRQEENEHKPETCRHTEPINRWLHRGYDGMDFCKRICGWEYVNEACVYHRQKERPEPIVMGQHQHVTAGHPLDFGFVIGDESPLAAFQHQWVIPARFIMPSGMDPTEPLAEVLHSLRRLAESDVILEGGRLLEGLGGAERVFEACADFSMPANAAALVPNLLQPEDSASAPFFHLPSLVPLLKREAESQISGATYPHRIVVEKGNLLLLLRHEVNIDLPKHIVWLDATGNERLYEATFRRPVKVVEPNVRMRGRIVQVVDRANGKGTFLTRNQVRKEERIDQVVRQVRTIVESNGLRNPGVITYQGIVDDLSAADFEALNAVHFYAARGTNRQEGVDGLIVAGTPQPSLVEIDKLARMLFFERMRPFAKNWTHTMRPFAYADGEGRGRAYPASGFWHDQDLQAILWQMREAELIQAVHRSRLSVREVTVWLLTNLPIDDLPPAELVHLRDVFDAPETVDVFLWDEFVRTVERLRVERPGEPLLASAIAAAMGVTRERTIRDYMTLLVERRPHEWALEPALVENRRGGRPRKSLRGLQ